MTDTLVAVEHTELAAPREVPFREAVMMAQDAITAIPGSVQGEALDKLCPLKHSFAPGIYVREIFIPAGTLMVGKIHKHEHPNFLMSGEVKVITESQGPEHLKAPLSIISPAGTKRCLLAITDVVWITVHENRNNSRDLVEIEDFVIAKSFEEYDQFKQLEASPQKEIL